MEGTTELQSCRWLVGFEEWREKSVAQLGVEDGDAADLAGDDVGVGAQHACDQAVEAKPTQVVAHLRCRVVGAGESGHQPAEALVGEAGDSVDDEAERTPTRAMAR